MTRSMILAVALSATLVSCGLGAGAEPDCLISDDCMSGELCRLERCVRAGSENAPPNARVSVEVTTPEPEPTPDPARPEPDPIEPEGPSESSDPEPSEEPVEGPSCGRAVTRGDLILNEFLVNVPAGMEGDANGDGERDAYEDEFVELVNVSGEPLELEGLTISNDARVKYTAPPGCLEPGQALVVFGGPKGSPPEHTASGIRAAAHSRFGFSNSGGVVRVHSGSGEQLVAIAYESPPEASYQLEPELTGVSYVAHPDPWQSAGRCVNGGAFVDGCALR